MRIKFHAGFSLAELLVALVASTTVMMVAVQILERSFATKRKSQATAEEAASLDQLVWQLRQDCGWASEIVVANSAKITLRSGSESITYAFSTEKENRVERVVSRMLVDSTQNEALLGERVAYESFRVGGRTASFERTSGADVSLVVRRTTEVKTQPFVIERVVELHNPGAVLVSDSKSKSGEKVSSDEQ